MSYGELERESASYANPLLWLGPKKGDRVAVQVEKRPQALYLGRSARRLRLPADEHRLPARGGAYFLGDAELTVHLR